jgi:hypothetical protein
MPPGRSRWLRRLLIFVVILVGLFVAADRIGVVVAENLAGQKIQDSQHLADRPDVDIAGFPFLTQLAAAHYDSVQITAHDIPVGPSERTLNLDTVTVHLHDVTTSRNFDEVRAATASADARITFDDLGRTLGAKVLSADGPGRVKASVAVSIAGQTISGAVSAAVSASDEKGLVFSDIKVEAAGVSIPGADTALGSAFRIPISLSGLPFNIHIAGLDVTSSAVIVHLTGSDLSYAPS